MKKSFHYHFKDITEDSTEYLITICNYENVDSIFIININNFTTF